MGFEFVLDLLAALGTICYLISLVPFGRLTGLVGTHCFSKHDVLSKPFADQRA